MQRITQKNLNADKRLLFCSFRSEFFLSYVANGLDFYTIHGFEFYLGQQTFALRTARMQPPKI